MKFINLFLAVCIVQITIAQELTVERIWKNYEFVSKRIDGFNSLPDGESFTKIVEVDGQQSLQKFTFKKLNGKGTELINLSAINYNGKQVEIEEITLSKSGNMAIIMNNMTLIYRRSYSAQIYLYDLKTKKVTAIPAKSPQTLPTLSPDEKKLAYVSDNNLYVFDIASGKNTAITTDGKINEIINGTTDWVYEEEFAITQGFGWSPDSKYLAFLRFDESHVKQFQMAIYGSLYPDQYTFKYPKAGEDNSKVTMQIADIESNKKSQLDLGKYEYIPRFQWSPVANELIVLTLNRHQNDLKYHLVKNPANPSSTVFFNEKNETFVEIDNNLLVLKDGKSLIRTSEASGYNHLYQLFFDGTQKAITSGSWDVIELYGIHEKTNSVYYASAQNGAIYRTLYSIELNGTNQVALSPLTGTHHAEFTQGFNYFVRTSSYANQPETYALCDRQGKELKLLEDNAGLKQQLTSMKLSQKEFIQVPGVAGNLNAWIMKPVGFDPAKKYPVYFTIYCGPGSNTVSDEFEGMNYMYHQLLCQKGYIVISVDPRGTMYRGEAFKKSTYKQLGKLETEDLIAVAKHVQTWNYVDKDRIGIQGWSYGGFMTALAMTKGADVFKTGISVAPVTNWRYYDNIYTERYMQLPQENASGYDDNSPVNHVSKLKGNFLLIHGSADDNVHYQNTMELITALVKANKQFDMFIYPNKNHGIYGGNTRNHLFHMMLDYTLKNL
ncbi:MAG: DPP IV N-terminal domain-containing protein [Fluviicola sp.]